MTSIEETLERLTNKIADIQKWGNAAHAVADEWRNVAQRRQEDIEALIRAYGHPSEAMFFCESCQRGRNTTSQGVPPEGVKE
jgi:hypothetical protein